MQCPKCLSAMKTISIVSKSLEALSGIEVERCDGCGALWFDRGEASALKGRSELVAKLLDVGDRRLGATMNLTRDIDCPKCGCPMQHTQFPGQRHVELESCPRCEGQLFDAGEFRDAMKLTFVERIRHAIAVFPKPPKHGG